MNLPGDLGSAYILIVTLKKDIGERDRMIARQSEELFKAQQEIDFLRLDVINRLENFKEPQ